MGPALISAWSTGRELAPAPSIPSPGHARDARRAMPCPGRGRVSDGMALASAASKGAWSTVVDAEVLVVLQAGPGAAPLPADRRERSPCWPVRGDHSGTHPVAVEVRRCQLGEDHVASVIRVLERVEIHGEA